MFYNNVHRTKLRQKHPSMKLTEMSKLIAEQWHKANDNERAPYVLQSEKDKIRYGRAMSLFHKNRDHYVHFMKMNYPGETIPWIKLPKTKKKGKTKKERKMKSIANLVNKVVRVSFDNSREITGWEYYFVLTYIPDLQWCRLAPMNMTGTFDTERNSISKGRIRWKLVQEGQALEVDVSAKRCTVVRTRVMKSTPNADEEEWDILDDKYYAPCEQFELGGNMYKSVAHNLLSPLLVRFQGMDLEEDLEEEEEEEENSEEDIR